MAATLIRGRRYIAGPIVTSGDDFTFLLMLILSQTLTLAPIPSLTLIWPNPRPVFKASI